MDDDTTGDNWDSLPLPNMVVTGSRGKLDGPRGPFSTMNLIF